MGANAVTKVVSAWTAGFVRKLHEPTDAASLAVFRMMFGYLIVWEVVRTVLGGKVQRYFLQPPFHFTYLGFEWVRPLPGSQMYDFLGFWALCGLLVAVGFLYRPAAILVFLGACYYFLLDQALYLNHMYLLCLVCFLMCFVGANRWASLDALAFRWQDGLVPYWHLFILRAQMFLVYFYAGVAKINGDWLTGEPVRAWLHRRVDAPLIGPLLPYEATVYFIAYGGLLFDLSIGFLLAWRKTRYLALPGVFFFHCTNKLLFNIGIFPEFALAITLLFLEPDWPRKVLAFLGRVKERVLPAREADEEEWEFDDDWEDEEAPPPRRPAPAPGTAREQEQKQEQDAVPVRKAVRQDWAPAFVAVWFAIQILLPLRHWLYRGDVVWTEEGHRFSWRMKLRDKEGRLSVRVRDPQTGKEWEVRPADYLADFQLSDATTRPDMAQQFARYLRDVWAQEKGVAGAQVFMRSVCVVNSSEEGELLDPNVDLAAEPRNVWPKRWILHEKPPRRLKQPYEPRKEDPAGSD